FCEVEVATGLIVSLADGAPPRALAGELGLRHRELVIGIAEEDQSKHRHTVFRRFQFGIGPEFICGTPKAFFEFGCVGWHFGYRLAEASSFWSSLRWRSIIATSSADTEALPPFVLARSNATRFRSSHWSAGRWTPVVLYGRSLASDTAVCFAIEKQCTACQLWIGGTLERFLGAK